MLKFKVKFWSWLGFSVWQNQIGRVYGTNPNFVGIFNPRFPRLEDRKAKNCFHNLFEKRHSLICIFYFPRLNNIWSWRTSSGNRFWPSAYIRVAQKQLILLFSVPHLNLCYLAYKNSTLRYECDKTFCDEYEFAGRAEGDWYNHTRQENVFRPSIVRNFRSRGVKIRISARFACVKPRFTRGVI